MLPSHMNKINVIKFFGRCSSGIEIILGKFMAQNDNYSVLPELAHGAVKSEFSLYYS